MRLVLIKRILYLGMVSLWRHRLRSALTVLGIVFGVCSVIAMLAIGEGASYEAQEQIKRLGSQNIIINSVQPPETEKASEEASYSMQYGLTYEDAERIHATIPAIEVMVPAKVIRSDVMYRTKRVDADVYGTVPWYPQTANKKILKGRFFTQKEALDGRNVCVLTNDLVKKLFTFEDPIGSRIRIRGEYFSVIGIIDEPVVAASGNSKAGNSNLNLFIPMTAARHRFGDLIMIYRAGSRSVEEVDLHKIIVKVDDVSKVMQTWEVIKDLLARFHKQQDYEIVVPLGLLREAARTKRIYNIVLGSIAAISLLVGGIGIMNIMLASVTERTREIGIRRALGARQKDIIIQFLTETVLLSTGGGLIGLMLGLAIPFLVTHFAGMMTIVRLWSLIVALGISILIGLIFGIYPAYRAAMMNPIEALRHE